MNPSIHILNYDADWLEHWSYCHSCPDHSWLYMQHTPVVFKCKLGSLIEKHRLSCSIVAFENGTTSGPDPQTLAAFSIEQGPKHTGFKGVFNIRIEDNRD